MAVLEELFLPAVEKRRVQAVLVAQVGHGFLLQEVQPEDGHLLLGRVVLACGRHGNLLRWVSLTATPNEGKFLFTLNHYSFGPLLRTGEPCERRSEDHGVSKVSSSDGQGNEPR